MRVYLDAIAWESGNKVVVSVNISAVDLLDMLRIVKTYSSLFFFSNLFFLLYLLVFQYLAVMVMRENVIAIGIKKIKAQEFC